MESGTPDETTSQRQRRIASAFGLLALALLLGCLSLACEAGFRAWSRRADVALLEVESAAFTVRVDAMTPEEESPAKAGRRLKANLAMLDATISAMRRDLDQRPTWVVDLLFAGLCGLGGGALAAAIRRSAPPRRPST